MSDLTIVEFINHIGHLMSLRTIAKFVDTTAIRVKLREIDVDFAQELSVHGPGSR